jgi:hypothetical protein
MPNGINGAAAANALTACRRLVESGFALMVLAVIVLLLASGCGGGGSAQDETLSAIDESIAMLNTNPSNWRDALDHAIAKLPVNADSTIRNELTNLSNRTVAAATEEFRCQTDFLGARAKEGLIRARAHASGQVYPKPEPVLCDITPALIDMNSPPEQRNQVALSGYDFDAADLQLFLVSPVRSIEVSDHLSRQTHYHATANLGASGVPISPEATKLSLASNGWEIGSVPIIQRTPPRCESESIGTDPVARTYLPPHVPPGDREFFGNVDITIKVYLLSTATHIDATIEMNAVEPAGDHTTARGTSEPFRVYTAPAGKVISAVLVPLRDELAYHDSTWEDDTFQGAGGAVRTYVARGDHYGEDAGTWTQVTVYFNAFNVQLTQTQDCQGT